uniref:HMG box domain-containing protein n=1 Tax=Periophthalmus magnuspinnatus TaxID=409849 RepID=A0A3B3Z8A4_9GOBI
FQFPGGSDNYLTISGSGHPFLSTSEGLYLILIYSLKINTFHTPSLGDEEFEIPPISLDPDSALSMSDVVSHFGGLSDPGAPDSVVVPENAVVEGEDPSFASTYGSSQGLEHLNLAVMNQAAGSALLGPSLGMDLGHSMASQFDNSSPVTIDVGLLGSSQLTTIDQSELSTHLGLGLGSGPMLPRATEEHPLSATASPTSSLHDDDMDDFRSVLVESPVSLSVSHGVISLDSSLSEAPDSGYTSTVSPAPARKAGGGKKGKGKKKDPNEPQKPVSAYALFFRDTQAAIKGQNPNATFGEVSKIVASMWDSLGEEQKQVYKRKNEIAKKEYLKALAEYRANQLNTTPIEVMDTSPSPPPPVPVAAAPVTTPPVATATRTTRSQHYNPEENTITNICTSNIIVDLPQVTTRSRTGAIKPTPLPPDSPTTSLCPVTKIIIKSTPLPSGGPPPLSAPPPPRLQQMVHAQTPPPLQAKPRGAGSTGAAAKAPPPLQIKVVPPQSSGRQDVVAVVKREEPVMLEVGGSTAVVTKTEDGAEAEEGMEVEVNVAPGPTAPPSVSPSICVRAGCTNKAVESKDWDREYCSNECVATHCRDVFMAWCAIRGQNSTTVT